MYCIGSSEAPKTTVLCRKVAARGVSCVKTVVFTLLFLLVTASAMAQNLAITHATVYSSPEATARRDVTVVIRNGVIAHVDEHVPAPRGIETIACQDCVVLAGFWNSHVHFMEPKWNDAAHQSPEKL